MGLLFVVRIKRGPNIYSWAFVTLEDRVVQSCPLNWLGLGSIHSVTKNRVLSTNVYLYYKIIVIFWLICAKQFTTQT